MGRDAARVVRIMAIARGPLRRSTILSLDAPGGRLTARAVDKAAARDLLAWMASPEVAAQAALEHGGLPASRAAARDPRFRTKSMNTSSGTPEGSIPYPE